MKKCNLILILILCSFNLISQVPSGFSYQAVVRSDRGEIVANQMVKFQFSLLRGSNTGTAVYVETQSVQTNEFGLANLTVGSGSKVSGDFDPSSWGVGSHFLKVELDPTNGSSFLHMGTVQLMAVPYAFHAQTAAEIPDHSVTTEKIAEGSVTGSKMAQGGASPGQVLKWNGTTWATAEDLQGGDAAWQSLGNNLYRMTGNIGIGTSNPNAQLHVYGTGAGEGNVLLTGELKLSPGNPPVSGAGTRLMWYPDKAAFRAGTINGDQWNKDNIGPFSFASGYQVQASGYHSASLGENTKATGNSSTSMGSYTTASGVASTATGYYTNSGAFSSMATGRYNVGGGSSTTWVLTDPLFEIGNGTSLTSRSNALTVLKNGYVGIGTANPAQKLDVRGTAHINGPLSIGTASARQQLSVGDYLDIYSGFANSPTRPSIRSSINNNLIISSYDKGILYFNHDGGTGETRFYNGSSSKELVRITEQGRVGIGTADPQSDLHIAGSIRVGENGTGIREIKIITVTLDNGYAEVPYPPGFGMATTMVLACQVYKDGFVTWRPSVNYRIRSNFIIIEDDNGSNTARLVLLNY
ncbi:MAG: hypothetical protein R6V75_02230 [Bacteroidales bacterium]